MRLISKIALTLVLTIFFNITSYAEDKTSHIDTMRLYLTTLELKEVYEDTQNSPFLKENNKRRLEVIKTNLENVTMQDSELLGALYILKKLNNPDYSLGDFANDEKVKSTIQDKGMETSDWVTKRMSTLPEFSGYGAERLLLAEVKFSLFMECIITKSDDICSFYAGFAELLKGFSLYTPEYLEAKEKYGVDTVGRPIWEARNDKPSEMVLKTFYEDPMTWVYPVHWSRK